ATKEGLFVAETHGAGEGFSVTTVPRIQFQIERRNDLADLLQNISTVLDHSCTVGFCVGSGSETFCPALSRSLLAERQRARQKRERHLTCCFQFPLHFVRGVHCVDCSDLSGSQPPTACNGCKLLCRVTHTATARRLVGRRDGGIKDVSA